MKRISALLLVVLLAGHPCANAQGFLKKLGKALDKVAAAGSQSSSSTQQAAPAMGGIPNVDIQMTSCVRWGNEVRVGFRMTSSRAADTNITFEGTDWQTMDSWGHCRANSQGGNALPCYVSEFANKGSMDQVVRTTMPSGVPINGMCRILNVPESDTIIARLDIGGVYSAGENVNKGFVYSCRQPIPITVVPNTNQKNVKCPIPIISVNFMGIRRVGKNVVVTYTLTSTQQDLTLIDVNAGNVYADDGNTYDFNIAYVGQEKYSHTVQFPKDVPIKGTMTISDVPQTVKQFALLRMQLAEGRYIEVRNEPIK